MEGSNNDTFSGMLPLYTLPVYVEVSQTIVAYCNPVTTMVKREKDEHMGSTTAHHVATFFLDFSNSWPLRFRLYTRHLILIQITRTMGRDGV